MHWVDRKKLTALPFWAKCFSAAALALLMFAAGFGTEHVLARQRQEQMAADARQENAALAAQASNVQLRVVDGSVQWKTNAQWHTYSDVQALLAGDPFASAQLPQLTPEENAVPEIIRGRAEGTVPAPKATAAPKTAAKSGTSAGAGETPSAPAAEPAAPPAEPAAPADTGSGDGENIEWSGDVL